VLEDGLENKKEAVNKEVGAFDKNDIGDSVWAWDLVWLEF
jgi:hypothetical protein